MKAQKKPVIIDYVIWDGSNYDEVMNFIGENCGNKIAYEDNEERCLRTGELDITTLEDGGDRRAKHVASKGDVIIRGVKGEFYPCKPDIFEQTYEKVD